jgi:hypothetical protein
MLLPCNLCVKELRDEASKKTDVLWLRTIRGVDYLVCKFHRRDYYERRESESSRVVQSVQTPV